jgi:hypothetical protein
VRAAIRIIRKEQEKHLSHKINLGRRHFATERGRLGYEKNRNDFNRLIWQLGERNAWSRQAQSRALYARSAGQWNSR